MGGREVRSRHRGATLTTTALNVESEAHAGPGQAPLRICIVVPYDVAQEGGVKRHAFHVAESLRRIGDEVVVVGPRSRGDPGAGFQGFGGVINVPFNGAANHMAILTPPWAVRRFFRTHDFDVVHIHEPLVPMLPHYALWFSLRAAHVCTFHMYAETVNPSFEVIRRALARRMLPRFERGIAVSRPAEEYAAGVWARPLSVIPNGVPTAIFRPPDGEHATRRDGPLRLLFVGHWRDPRKGLTHLLHACEQLRGAGLPVCLDVVGEGRAEPGERPGVTFHGPIASETVLAERYRRCDVLVAPATGQESFGIVLLEAMACARPVICSDIPGYRHVVGSDGARLVPPGDARELARAIAELARDPGWRESMGERNRRRAEAYDWGCIARRIRDEYVLAVGERQD